MKSKINLCENLNFEVISDGDEKPTTDIQPLEYLRREIEHNGIYRCRPGIVIPAKAPNRGYTWQFYLRRCLYNPQFMLTAANEIISRVDLKNKQLGACEDAGVPIALAISHLTGIPVLTIKKTRKSYGLLNFTEGKVTGDPVVLVDDLAGSQTTFRKAKELLETFNIPVDDQYIALVNKTQGTHDSYLSGKLISLFTCEDFAMTWEKYIEKYGVEPNFGYYC